MSRVAYEFDPFELAGVEPPKDEDRRSQAMDEIADYVKNEVLGYCADGSSPVSGGSWDRTLSKEYKKRKIAEGGQGFANLELTGDLMNSVMVQNEDDTLVLTVSEDQQPKADGHNNFSGDSTLPPRQFVPNSDAGQTFRREIIRGIRQIAEEFADEADNGD